MDDQAEKQSRVIIDADETIAKKKEPTKSDTKNANEPSNSDTKIAAVLPPAKRRCDCGLGKKECKALLEQYYHECIGPFIGCFREEIGRISLSEKDQIRNLAADNMHWRKQYEIMKRERDAKEYELQSLESVYGMALPTRNPNPKKERKTETETAEEERINKRNKRKLVPTVRERLNPDGTITPSCSPLRRADGRYVWHLTTPPPSGYRWDEIRGLWTPKIPEMGAKEDGYTWDHESGVWRIDEGLDRKKRWRCKVNPDGSMTPTSAPKLLSDGTFAWQKGGRAPKGYGWDATRGLWVHESGVLKIDKGPDPKKQRRSKVNPDGSMTPASAPKLLSDGTFARQKGGRTPKGYEWDATRGLWVQLLEDEEEEAEGMLA